MEKLINLKEAAALLNYNSATIRNLIKAGTLKAYRHSPKSQIRLKTSELEKLMQRGSKAAK